MTLSNLPPRRPWYCIDSLTDDYRAILVRGGDFRMLRLLKVLRSIIVNVGIIGVTLYALVATTADATLVATMGIITLGLYNGVEVADYAALAQAFAEVQASKQQDDDDRRQ